MRKEQRGFTVLEMLITLVVISIIAGLGVPSYISMLAKRRIEGAASALQTQFQQLRSQAIKRNSIEFLSFAINGSNWSYGVNDNAACNPALAGNCTVNGVSQIFNGSDWKGVTIALSQSISSNGNSVGFEPRRGMTISPGGAISSGTITLQSAAGSVQVNVSPIGYISICSPAGSGITRYSSC
ncbi:MAG: GspH/FimT family pseudopilin [Stenotrophobium sp.]